MLNACVTLGSFVVILWKLSAAAPVHLFGLPFVIPGYLVWAALIYAVIGTSFTHLLGWPLITLNFRQQRFEADFRFNLVRSRENSEQIASLHGEAAERERHLDRFGSVVSNWIAIMQRQKKLLFFTQSYSQASVIFPYVMVSPAYFSGVHAARRPDANRIGLQQRADRAVLFRHHISNDRRVSGGGDAAVRFRTRDRGRPRRGADSAGHRGRAARWQSRDRHRPSRRRPAQRRAAAQCRATRAQCRRPCAGEWPLGRRQIDAVPRHRRHLAVRIGPRHRADGRQGHAGAAAAVFPGGDARRRHHLSGQGRQLRRRAL